VLRIKLLVSLLPLATFAFMLAYSLNLLGFEGQTLYYAPPAEIQEVKGDKTIGQTFVAPLPGLHRVDVMLFSQGRRNTRDVTFHLRQGLNSPTDIVSITFNALAVKGREWYTFDFPPLPDSADKTYYFYFSSPKSTDGDAIAVGGIQVDLYPGGEAYFGSTPTKADVAFRTYYSGVTLRQKAERLLGRLAENRPFLWGNRYFYVLLVIVYLAVVTALVWRLGDAVFNQE
jgi:hypothetical protein